MHSAKLCSGVVPGARLVASLRSLSSGLSSPLPVTSNWHSVVSRQILTLLARQGRYTSLLSQTRACSIMGESSGAAQLAPEEALLPCQLDSYERSCQATVLSCQPIAPVAPPKAKGKQAQASAAAGKPGSAGTTLSWAVSLDQSPLYPEGGGQPSDTGTLEVIRLEVATAQIASTAESSAVSGNPSLQRIAITGVAREGGKLIHYTDAQVPVGASVCVRLDWARRYDLMQQHTGDNAPYSSPYLHAEDLQVQSGVYPSCMNTYFEINIRYITVVGRNCDDCLTELLRPHS